MKKQDKQRGLTLIELMISLALGLILAAAAVSIFVGNKQAYKLQEAVSTTQENGRFAMNALISAVRPASGKADPNGVLGGISLEEFQNMTNCGVDSALGTGGGAAVIGYEADIAHGATGFTAAGTAATQWSQGDSTKSANLPTSIFSQAPMRGRDIILLSTPGSAVGCGGDIGVFNPTNVHVEFPVQTTPLNCGLSVCDVVVIVKDNYAAMFTVTEISAAVKAGYIWEVKGQTNNSACPCNNATHKFDTDPHGGSMIVPQKNVYTAYYIAANNSGRYSLWKVEGPNFDAPQELVEGVFDMQLTYYQDLDGDLQISKVGSENGKFIKASAVTDWDEVIAVRVDLLMESDQQVLDSEQSYDFNDYSGTSPDPTGSDDLRLKKTFSLTVAVRNKVL
jgi:type IV pilus assembly protein PilW